MITFDNVKEGIVTVTSDTHPPLTFTVRPMGDDEDIMNYMEHIMNAYWYKVGKNRRSYYEEYD